MAWRIIEQPDGKFARFSEVVDDFTHFDMTREEAVDLCRDWLGIEDSEAKVSRSGDLGMRGQTRWDEAIRVIRAIHGDDVAKLRIKEILKRDVERMSDARAEEE